MSKRRVGTSSSNSQLGPNKKRTRTAKFRFGPLVRQSIKKAPQLALDFVHSWDLVKLLIAIEVLINYLVIGNVKYTEIDWSTYMAQANQIFNRTNLNFDYRQIEGPTGPLVYPAGHVYIYYLLREMTDGGSNIQFAQHIFACIYIAQLILVYKLYSHKRTLKHPLLEQIPPYIFVIMCLTSYRIHSIYILRLFNDPIAVLLAYASFYAFLKKQYYVSSFLFSFAVSVKMNILLFAPAYALIYLEDVGLARSIKYGSVAFATQLILAAPFLWTNPIGYFERAFNFGRVFQHKWTVNWRFLSEETFTSPSFFRILLLVHVVALFLIYAARWLATVLPKKFIHRRDDPILTLFIINFIGVACSRSLHYQFYVWYYHSLPMILWATQYNVAVKLLILGCIEFAWNQYPSTNFSSLLLQACHLAIFLSLLASKYVRPRSANRK